MSDCPGEMPRLTSWPGDAIVRIAHVRGHDRDMETQKL